MVNEKAGSDGESKGTSIQNGKSQPIAVGAIVHIPAGTPHQLTIAAGDVFGAIVVTARETKPSP
jgi:quercetin dioxygenase-like cupin family protein